MQSIEDSIIEYLSVAEKRWGQLDDLTESEVIDFSFHITALKNMVVARQAGLTDE